MECHSITAAKKENKLQQLYVYRIEDAEQIMDMLEKTEIDLAQTTEQYNRMIQLNNHIQSQFKKKASEIRQLAIKKNKKNKKKKK